MRGGYPVKIVHYVEGAWGCITTSTPFFWDSEYFQVRIGRQRTCGHRHKTEKAAEPCLKRGIEQWKSMLSQNGRMAAYRRHRMPR